MKPLVLAVIAALGFAGLIGWVGSIAGSSQVERPGAGAENCDPSNDAASADIAKFAKDLKNANNPEEQKAAKALQDFLASAPNPQGPLWAADNLGWHTDRAMEYRHIVSTKPSYYSGPMPFSYTEGDSPGGVLFFYDFGAFRNQFKLSKSFEIRGARTVDKSGTLLAETRVRYYVNGRDQGIELEEFHYDSSGKVYFRSKSEIDANSGFKIKEHGTCGRKIRDYYFLWPARMSAVR